MSADKLKQNWQVIAAAAAGVAAVGLGLYLLLRTPEADIPETASVHAKSAESAPASTSTTSSSSSTTSSSSAAARPAAASTTTAVAASGSPSRAAAGTATHAVDGVAITKDHLKVIMTDMAEQLETLKDSIDAKKAALERIGKSPEEIMAAIQEQQNAGLEKIDKSVMAKYGVDEFALMEAQNLHMADPEIAALMNRLRTQFFGEDQTEQLEQLVKLVPEDMTPEKFYAIMVKHMGILEAQFKIALLETKDVTKDATFEERASYFQYSLGQRLQDIHASSLAQIGLSDEEFNGCMIKYVHDPNISKVVMESQAKQQEMMQTMLRD